MAVSGCEIEEFDCPHCPALGARHRLLPAAKGLSGMTISGFRVCLGATTLQIDVSYRHLLYACESCGLHTYLLFRQKATKTVGELEVNVPAAVVHQFPNRSTAEHADGKIPPQVGAALVEAELCLAAGAWNACGIMAARAAHLICDQLAARSAHRLYDRLEELWKEGKLTEELQGLVKNLKDSGGDGSALEWECLGKDEAEKIVALIRGLVSLTLTEPCVVQENLQIIR